MWGLFPLTDENWVAILQLAQEAAQPGAGPDTGSGSGSFMWIADFGHLKS